MLPFQKKQSSSKKVVVGPQQQPPQMSASGFSNSTMPSVPGSSKEVQKARGKPATPAVERKVSKKKINAKDPLSKEFGIDQQGCEPTQASREDSYQADVAHLEQARKK